MRTQRFELLASYFRKKRIQAGLTQDDVARELGYSSPQLVSNWERGVCAPPMKFVPRLATLLGARQKEVVSMFLRQTRQEIEGSFIRRSKRYTSRRSA